MKAISNRCRVLIFSFSIFSGFLFGCQKQETKKTDPETGLPVTPGGPSVNCAAVKADAESIMIFPADNAWNLDVSNAPVDPNSTQIINSFSTSPLKADFGSGLWDGAPIGIPYTVVCGSQEKIRIEFRANGYDDNYGDESDPGPYPIPLNTPVEGNATGDAHVIAVDKDNGILYELYNASVTGDHWGASSGAVFDLKSNALRPDGWTSADAAGLPIFPGLVRYEEVLKGKIDHAIRFTLTKSNVKAAYIAPARHKVNGTGGTYSTPFGAKLRLKQNYDISGFSPEVQIILTAMKKYGIILADIGSNMFVIGAPDDRWDNDALQKMGQIKASDFEVIKIN